MLVGVLFSLNLISPFWVYSKLVTFSIVSSFFTYLVSSRTVFVLSPIDMESKNMLKNSFKFL